MALDKGENALAEVARKKADQVDSESLGKICINNYIAFDSMHQNFMLQIFETEIFGVNNS